METFTWKVITGTTGSGEFKMDSVQFGDGYSQDSATGLNPERQNWPVVVQGFKSEIEEVLDFIRANFTGFYWKPPLSPQATFKCNRWNATHNGGDHWSLSLEFEKVYRVVEGS